MVRRTAKVGFLSDVYPEETLGGVQIFRFEFLQAGVGTIKFTFPTRKKAMTARHDLALSDGVHIVPSRPVFNAIRTAIDEAVQGVKAALGDAIDVAKLKTTRKTKPGQSGEELEDTCPL